MNFNDFYWHDSVIKEIIIDRNNPGRKDEIQFDILFPDKKKIVHFFFENVQYASFHLNFGIIAEETILEASMLENDIDLSNLYLKWNGLMDDVELTVYSIKLNSTGGNIKIIAKGIRIE